MNASLLLHLLIFCFTIPDIQYTSTVQMTTRARTRLGRDERREERDDSGEQRGRDQVREVVVVVTPQLQREHHHRLVQHAHP